MPTITPFLWFDDQLDTAIAYYCSVFDRVEVLQETRYGDAGPGPAGSLMTATVEIEGTRFMGLNGGPQFPFTEAFSFFVACDSQEQADRYWHALQDGGKASQCGWVADRFGLWWQLVPPGLLELLSDAVPARAEAATRTMLGQQRLDVAAIRAAADAA